jgi:hypothetical protein
MSKLIKRADGSYSKRGLWDNIRANKGSGKKPTKQMLEQERKIKNEEKMKNMYKKGGKSTTKKKSSFIEDSKEITFGNKPKPMEYKEGGKKARLEARAERVMGRAQKNWKKAEEAMEYDRTANPETSNATGYANKKYNKAAMQEERAKKIQAKADAMKKGGFPDLNKDGKTTFADVLKGRGAEEKMMGGKTEYKKGGKSMKPGGGGRFAAMVGKLKKEGKSEDSAKAIAASAGRKKYGKSRFQEMAAAGKRKKEEGGFEDEEMEMEITESSMKPPKKRKKVNASAAARKRGNAARKNQRRGRTGCYSGNCAESMPEI